MKKLMMMVALAALGGAWAGTLEKGFENPPDSAKPWCYWWWINGHVDKETITADLEAMKRLGFGGLLMFDSRGYWDDERHVVNPKPEIPFMSPEWQEYVVHAIKEAARLGLKFTMNMSSSGGKLDGPWEVGPDAPKRLVYRYYAPDAAFEQPADMAYYHDIVAQEVWYTGDALAVPSDWMNGGDGEITRSHSSQTRYTSIGGGRKRTLVAKGTPGAKCVKVRFGYAALPEHQHDVDVLDPKAVTGHFNRFQGELQKKIPGLVGRDKTLSHLYSVSWEGSVPTWTGDFAKEFKKYAGFDILPNLPLLAGFELPDTSSNETFLRAYRRARNDMFRENFYGTMRDLAHARNIDWYSESGGPFARKPAIFREADQLAFLGVNDMPQGEFWPWGRQPNGEAIVRQGVHGRFHVRGAVASAHMYGRPRAAAEAFTHMHLHWSVDPAFLKPLGDEGYLAGINHYVWHTFTCSPKKFGVPGAEYFAGSHINRNVTWHREFKAFVTYLGRCQWLLQQGQPVEDYAVYAGDRPYMNWSPYADKPYDSSKAKLPKGHAYDVVNDFALLNRFTMKDGRLTLPEGISYGALVWDPEFAGEPLNAQVLAKVESFKQAGLKVVPAAQAADAVVGLAPDYEGPFGATHRRDGATDIYFVAGTGAGTMTFREKAVDRAVEVWNPLTGARVAADFAPRADGRTDVKLDLPKDGSTFVLFRPVSHSNVQAFKHSNIPPSGHSNIQVPGPWRVSFAFHDGITAQPPADVTLDVLKDFTTFGTAGQAGSGEIRYFAGAATYRTTLALTVDAAARATELSLGTVPTGLASVKVNGRDLGVAWCAPWTVSAKGAFRAGANEIEIRYVNNWYNRLAGDCFLSDGTRVTKSTLRYWNVPRAVSDPKRPWEILPTVYSGYSVSDPLQPSGLLGPVTIR